MDRRRFLRTMTGLAVSGAAAGSLPLWARRAVGASTPAVAPIAPGPASGAAELLVRGDRPEQWETTLESLGRSWFTRNDRFFVRSHLSTPDLDPATFCVEIAGLVERPLTIPLAELVNMPRTEETYTLECAGNGRGLYVLPSTSGTQWERGAVGNSHWGGMRLASLLLRAGVKAEAKHVWFEAADMAPLPDVPRFLRSVPIEKAMRDVLMAYTMGGIPLPALHGGPLRAIVPGWYGMAWTKWVTKVRVEAQPSDNHFMVKGYHYNYPGEDPATAPPVEEMRVKSVITRPLEGVKAVATAMPKRPSRLRIQGFAWAGPSGVRLVEVSTDGGQTWSPAGFMGETAPLAWRAWATEIDVRPPARVRIMARATDNNGEAQPLEARPNAAGYGNNSIHRITVDVRA